MQQTPSRPAFVVVLLLWHAIPLAAQTASATPPFSAPGRLIDLGGWRLHLNCTGQPRAEQPTVILEAGAGISLSIGVLCSRSSRVLPASVPMIAPEAAGAISGRGRAPVIRSY